jgi:hypothetical protein
MAEKTGRAGHDGWRVDRLVEETEAHVFVGLFLLLFLLFLLSRSSLSSTASSSGATCSRGSSRTTTGANVQEEILDILALESLGEESGPDGLDLSDTGGLDDGVQLVGLQKQIGELVTRVPSYYNQINPFMADWILQTRVWVWV